MSARVMPGRLRVALPLLIMGAFYWLSSLPGVPSAGDPPLYAAFHWLPPSVQDALHGPAYATLASAWCWALCVWLRAPGARAAAAFAIASAFGILDEWHQSFVPARYASFTDIALDVAGAAIGIWLAIWMQSRLGSHQPVAAAGKHRSNLPGKAAEISPCRDSEQRF